MVMVIILLGLTWQIKILIGDYLSTNHSAKKVREVYESHIWLEVVKPIPKSIWVQMHQQKKILGKYFKNMLI